MKRTLFQLFNVLMACLVLLSSTGFGLVEHSCQMRGKKKTMVVAFSDNSSKAGCADARSAAAPDQTTVKKSACCQDEQRYENVDVTSSLTQLVAKFIKVVAETILSGVTAVLTWIVDWVFSKSSASVSVFSSPPSPSGRDILTFVQRLLI